jgi:signal transduction histidine kinase
LRTLGPGSLEFPDKLTRLARQATASHPVRLSLKIDAISLGSRPELEYQLLRIAQEAISNSLRHACAKELEVQLRSDGKHVELLIADDGNGFDSGRSHFGHFGLLGMRERAGEIGAELAIESTPGQGTTVRVSLPLSHDAAPGSKPEEALEHQIG